ncbi:phospholipase [Rhizobium sp. ACO-34A]|nr:dienelactone hydrolase family protein [Rhizobium sp. ACO-34A]ATN33841.1 phospholipase [Rhizobium sp. ACO-34A]
MTNSEAKALVIFLHGVGSNGADLAALAPAMAPALPGVAFESPDGSQPCDFNSGYQWFSVAGVTPENRAERIRAARGAFDAVVSESIKKHGFSDRLDRVAFVGFSQGTIMALDALVSGRWPVGAIVGFSGRLATNDIAETVPSVPVLLQHGTMDSVIPVGETQDAEKRLKALGVPVETLIVPGLGHSISAPGLDRASAFLAEHLA